MHCGRPLGHNKPSQYNMHVHIAEEFRLWLKEAYPRFLLAYAPANCTSKMQIADLTLNRPLKACFTGLHQNFMIMECRRHIAGGGLAKDVKFSEAVSKCAGIALSWLLQAYANLSSVDLHSHLVRIGYMRCWEDSEFRLKAINAERYQVVQ
jgi:hypothetical protein